MIIAVVALEDISCGFTFARIQIIVDFAASLVLERLNGIDSGFSSATIGDFPLALMATLGIIGVIGSGYRQR